MILYAVDRPFDLLVASSPLPRQLGDRGEHRLPAQPRLAGDRPDARVGPVRAEVGVEPDDQVDLDRRAAQGLERLGPEQVVLDAEEVGGHDLRSPSLGPTRRGATSPGSRIRRVPIRPSAGGRVGDVIRLDLPRSWVVETTRPSSSSRARPSITVGHDSRVRSINWLRLIVTLRSGMPPQASSMTR